MRKQETKEQARARKDKEEKRQREKGDDFTTTQNSDPNPLVFLYFFFSLMPNTNKFPTKSYIYIETPLLNPNDSSEQMPKNQIKKETENKTDK